MKNTEKTITGCGVLDTPQNKTKTVGQGLAPAVKKIASLLLAITMLFSITAGIDLSAYAFTQRTTQPTSDNAYYYKNNPFYKSGYGMPNCTCYAFGRVYEVNGVYPNLSTGNAATFYTYNSSHGYYSYGSVPKAGSIACWSGGTSGAGHVAFVESVNSNGTINISESNWSGRTNPSMAFRYLTNINPSTYSSSLKFQGYIYCCSNADISETLSPVIYDDKNTVVIGEKIVFSYSGLKPCSQVKFNFMQNNKVYYSVDSTSSTTFTTYFEKEGTYQVYVSGYINGKWINSDTITVNVLNPKISSNKNSVLVNESITFKYSGLTKCSKAVFKFMKNGNVYYTYDSTSSTDFTTYFQNEGIYQVYASGYLNGNWCDSNKITIEVKTPVAEHKHSYDDGVVTKSATCKATGVKTYTCTVCGATKTETIAKTAHTYKTTTTKATTKKNGSKVTKCSVCGVTKSSTTIYYPKTITLSKTSYVYNGKAKKPSVTVKDSKGKKIASSNYTVSYQSGRKNVGKYTVTIKFKGNYSGTFKKTFTIKPKATTLSSVTAGKKKFTAKWKKLTTQTTGYQIQYSTDKNFKKNNKTVTISKNKTTSKSVSKLKAKKKYYVKIRTYKTVKVNGKSTKIYSAWSKSKAVTTKK